MATLQLNYVILASHAEDGGMVTTDWMAILGDMSRRTAPVLQAALGAGFDRHRMEVAAHEHRAEISELEQTLPKVQDALVKGGRWTRRGVYVADGVTLAMAAYDVLGLLEGGVGGGPEVPLRFPGLAGAGGVRSSHVFDWSSSGDRTIAHLARIEGKWFVVQFYAEGPLAGELATAFVPNQAELGAMLGRLGH